MSHWLAAWLCLQHSLSSVLASAPSILSPCQWKSLLTQLPRLKSSCYTQWTSDKDRRWSNWSPGSHMKCWCEWSLDFPCLAMYSGGGGDCVRDPRPLDLAKSEPAQSEAWRPNQVIRHNRQRGGMCAGAPHPNQGSLHKLQPSLRGDPAFDWDQEHREFLGARWGLVLMAHCMWAMILQRPLREQLSNDTTATTVIHMSSNTTATSVWAMMLQPPLCEQQCYSHHCVSDTTATTVWAMILQWSSRCLRNLKLSRFAWWFSRHISFWIKQRKTSKPVTRRLQIQ